MQPALQETYEEISGIYEITPEGPTLVRRPYHWFSSFTRRTRLRGYVESLLVTLVVIGVMGLTALAVAAHYDSVKSSQTISAQPAR